MSTTLDAPAPTATATRPIGTALAGIALTTVSVAVSTPEYPAELTPATAREYVIANSDALLRFGMASAACTVLLVVLLAYLRQRMTGALRDVVFGSGLLVSVWMLLTGAFHASAPLDIDRAEWKPDEMFLQTIGLQIAGDSIGATSTYAKGALMLAVGIAAIRTRFLPRWLGWLSAVLGGMAVGAGLGVVENPVTPVLFYGGLLGFAIWPLIVGITILIRKP
jgi:hypothetical protein